jgi:DNA-binding MarR family transcriptional regulator
MTKVKKMTKASKAQTVRLNDDVLQEFMGYHVKRASNIILGDLAQVLKPLELRMITFTALSLIVDNPGVRPSHLADALNIERPNFVVVVDELEQREHISRERVATDRRAYAFNVTLAGRRLYEQARLVVIAHEEALLVNLTQKQKNQVIAAMKLISLAGVKGSQGVV